MITIFEKYNGQEYKIGDFVKYFSSLINDWVDGIYEIKKIERTDFNYKKRSNYRRYYLENIFKNDDTGRPLDFGWVERSQIRLATQDEVEQAKLEKAIKKYNL